MSAIVDCLNWFRSAKPLPTNKDIHTQIGCHLEEVAEMLEEITVIDGEDKVITQKKLTEAIGAIEVLATHLKRHDNLISIEPDNRVNFIDAISDQLVTATGIAYMLKMDPDGAWNEVNRSNFSKFDTNGNPIFNEDRKIIKGPEYSKAVLDPFC